MINIDLTPTQEAFVREAIARGHFDRPEDAVAEALLLWEERQRQRETLIASLDEAQASLDRGEGILIDGEDATRALIEDIDTQGRQRVAAHLGR